MTRNWAGCASPWVIVTYGNWDREAHITFSCLTSQLAVCASTPNGKVPAELSLKVCGKNHFGKKPALTCLLSVVYALYLEL